MAKQLNLSLNELWALLTRTFEALYGHERDYYDMARTVLWLECHGHDGVEQLINVLPTLENDNLMEPSFSDLKPGYYVVDGKGHSLLCIGRSVCDLAMSYAEENETSHIDIRNVVDSKPLIGLLSYAASRNFSSIAICEDSSAFIGAGCEYPTLYMNRRKSALSLICTLTNQGANEFLHQELELLMDGDAQKERYSSSLEGGLYIKRSDYEILNLLADKVLVESTPESRQGAGE